jgi:hypothetical protein
MPVSSAWKNGASRVKPVLPWEGEKGEERREKREPALLIF